MAKTIDFRVRTDKSKYIIGEPVIAYTEISNSGTEPLSVIDLLDPKFGIVKYYVINEKNEQSIFRPILVADFIEHSSLLEPRKSIVHKGAKIFYGGNGWTFSSPGQYRLRASYEGAIGDSELTYSNTALIEIASPRNHDEEEQVNLILGREQGLFLLFESGDHLSNGISALSELVRKFPQSDLAGYADFALGKNYSMDFRDFDKLTVREADLGKTISHLENAKDKDIGSYFRGETYVTLADAYDRSNNHVAAKKILREFIQISSDDTTQSENLMKAKRMLDEGE